MLGLILASVDSLVNVLTDVARKKVLDRQYDAGIISVWCKLISCVVFGVIIAVLALFWGTRLELPDIGKSLGVSPMLAFIFYITLNAVLEGTAVLLNLRALQVSPLSYCVPFMALTPLFLLPAGAVFLKEAVSAGMIIGVFLIVTGSLVVNRQLFAQGWLEPARAIVRERGSRYMLIVAVLLTITNVLDKWFLTNGAGAVSLEAKFARTLTLSAGKCAMLSVFFIGLTLYRLGNWKAAKTTGRFKAVMDIHWTKVLREMPAWLVLAGVLESLVLILMLTAMQFSVAAVVISIKRAGVIFAVVLGWFVFQERGITDRIIASLVMASGVVIFFLTKPDAAGHVLLNIRGAMIVAGMALTGMAVALHLTRNFSGQPAKTASNRSERVIATKVLIP